jgi:hypothetical protein
MVVMIKIKKKGCGEYGGSTHEVHDQISHDLSFLITDYFYTVGGVVKQISWGGKDQFNGVRSFPHIIT